MKKFSLRDSLLILGLVLLGFGLYMLRPWIAFSVCGVLILVAGLLMKDNT